MRRCDSCPVEIEFYEIVRDGRRAKIALEVVPANENGGTYALRGNTPLYVKREKRAAVLANGSKLYRDHNTNRACPRVQQQTRRGRKVA